MNKNAIIAGVVGVAAGFSIGYYIGGKLMLKKCEKYAMEQPYERPESGNTAVNEEAESVNYNRMTDSPTEEVPLSVQFRPADIPVPDPELVMKRPHDLPPTAIGTPDGYPDPDDLTVAPYLIREQDYGSLQDDEETADWNTTEFILWACGTVTYDDSDCVPVDPQTIGMLLPDGWQTMFGWGDKHIYDYAIYFRNNTRRMDIQIDKDNRTYAQWIAEAHPERK